MYRVSNLRRIRRRSNKRRIIRGNGFLDFLRKRVGQGKQWLKDKLPGVLQGVKEVGGRHLQDLVKSGIPLNKQELLNRGKSFAKDAFSETKSRLKGEGKLHRVRKFPYPAAKRLRYRM